MTMTDDIISSCIYSYYTKYDILSKLIQENYAGSNDDIINIYIDVQDIIKKIPYYGSEMRIIPPILNMCGHYRWFFRKNLNVKTRIFLIYSDYNYHYIYKQYMPIYRKFNLDNSRIYDSINYLSKIVRYIPDVHFIHTQFEFGVRVLDIINNDRKAMKKFIPNLIISKDVYNYQLVFFDINILRPKKYNGEDISEIINADNVYHHLFRARKCGYIDNILNTGLVPLVMSLNRIPERNIPRMYNLDKVVKVMNSLVFDNLMSNCKISDIVNFCDIFNSRLGRSKKINPNNLLNIYKVVDIENQYLYMYRMLGEISMYNGIVNLTDTSLLDSINGKFDYKIDLAKLL